jgi:hypothetical protein
MKKVMKNDFAIAVLALTLVTAGLGQAGLGQGTAKPEPEPGGDITGLYTFVHEGEFVQIEANDGKVTGIISRFKNEDQEKAEFVDQFFTQAKLEGSTLSFRTGPAADGVWFEFTGTVESGAVKSRRSEGHWTVKGKLTEHSIADGKVTETVRELTLKSFPEDAEPDATGKTEGQGAGETPDKKE